MEEENKKHLMVNYLPSSFSSEDLEALFSRVGPVEKCKLIRDHATGESLGYGFIEYGDEHFSANAMTVLNGMVIDGKKLKISYARPTSRETKNRNVYVANLSPHVTEGQFHELFSPFGDIETIKLLTNSDGISRGVGLVRYMKSSDAAFAIENMNEKTIDADTSAPLIVKLALPPKHLNAGPGKSSYPLANGGGIGAISRNSNFRYNPMRNTSLNVSTNSVMCESNDNFTAIPLPYEENIQPATVYVYGLLSTHGELTLYELFSPFGGILNVNAVRDFSREEKPCKGFGFVNFTKYEDAYKAVTTMNNLPFHGKVLHVSFKETKAFAANYGNTFSVMAP